MLLFSLSGVDQEQLVPTIELLVCFRSSFFKLGGQSLLTTQLLLKIRASTGHAIRFVDFFNNPSVKGTATLLDESSHKPVPASPTLQSGTGSAVAVPSTTQRRLLYLSGLQPNSASYNILFCLILESELQLQSLKHALEVVVSRHSPLRTHFDLDPSTPGGVLAVERSASSQAVTIRVFEVMDADRDAARATASNIGSDEYCQPFNLTAEAALIRATVVKLVPHNGDLHS